MNYLIKNMGEIRLRPARISDMDLIFQWANDDECRKNSFHIEKIDYEDHVKWFQSKLNTKQCDMFIVCRGEMPIGQIRLDYEGKKAIISYSVAKEERRKGYGKIMLQLLEQEVKNQPTKIDTLEGLVKEQNIASQKKFEEMGYSKQKMENCYCYTKKIDINKDNNLQCFKNVKK